MFSKELYELDRNTVRYMIDELQEENKHQKKEILQQKDEILQQKDEILQQKDKIFKQKDVILKQKDELRQMDSALHDALKRIRELESRS